MITFRKTILAVSLLFIAMTVAMASEVDASQYQTNKPFGWATCSDINGTPYIVDGGMRNADPKTVVLYASGGDDRQAIVNAIANYDIVVLDGSKGDFILSSKINFPDHACHKSILGRNNARLCTQWYITPELKAVLEAANLDRYSTSSGTGGTLSNGREVDEERELHTRQTIIDYFGDKSENYRKSGFFSIGTTHENIVFRNLTFVGPGSVDVGGADIISNNGATHVWIDHCEFIDGMDGNLDSGKREGSEQFVTYSWNIFRYTDRSYSHPYSNGMGWNKGYLQYCTYAYNIWGAGCKYRLPQADWVYIHVLNNHYDCAGNSVAVAINANSHALVEGNYAESGVNNTFMPGGYSDLYYVARNNYGFGSYNNKSNTSKSLEVPYQYSFITATDVPATLAGKHGAGATIDDIIDDYINPVMTAPETYYSRRMTESQGKAWSADKSWDYVSGLVTKSLLKCTTQYPDDEWSKTAYEWCKQYADKALNSDGSFKSFKKGNIDNIASGKVFFELYHREKAKGTAEGEANATKYKAAAEYLYKYLRNDYSRIQTGDGKGGFFHKDIYPNQMWLDGLYMGAAFYAEYLYNFAPDDTEGWSDIANQFKTIHRHTYDAAKKLNYHGWSADPTDSNSFWAKQSGDYEGCSSEFWGRGMGWYFAALTDVLEMMPQSHADYAGLKDILQQVAEGLRQWQDDKSGVWYQLLQYDDTFVGECGSKNYLEASASCMFTYSYLKALRLGLIPESYRATAEKAYQGVLKTFVTENSDKSLNLIKSCKSAGLGPAKNPQRDGSASYYLCGSDVTVVSNEGKSIGPFIMASLEWEQAYGDDEPSEPETPENPTTPEVPDDSDEPSEPETIVYKEFATDMVLLTTTEKVTGRNWIEGGETSSTKAGTIDPLTGSAVTKYSGGGIMLKKGNSAKALATYITGVSKVIAYGCTAGSTDRNLVVSATAEEGGEAIIAKATSSGYQSVAVALELDGTKKYKVEYTGVDASDEEKGSDMVLHGIKFVAGTASGISEIETGAMPHDVYTISGVKVGRSQDNLPKGIYIINTKKVVVR